MKLQKKVLFITGTRADFGKLKPLLHIVENSQNLICNIFATGMHTLKLYGNTYHEIIKANFKNIHLYINQFEGEPMELILANTIAGLSRFVRENKPDMIIVHGDRLETLAGAIVGTFNNILTCHIEGGEVSGTIDELIRHSVSKLAHLHLVSNNESKKRLIQMGEEEKSIFIIGSPDIDVMISPHLPSLQKTKEKYGISFDQYAIALLHPVTTEITQMMQYAKIFVSTLIESKKNFVVIYPNNDIGTHYILNEYSRLKMYPSFRLLPSLQFEYFLTLLKHSQFIIGNSSAGIREAPAYGLPAINIGSRQNNRYSYKSIINCEFNLKKLLTSITKALCMKNITPSLYFGQGTSAKEFSKFIHNKATWESSPQKKFRDIPNISFELLYQEKNHHDRNNTSQKRI